MDIDVRFDTKKVSRALNRVQRQQIPFAASQALNDVAFKSTAMLKVQAEAKLDRPTPFTLRGFLVLKSTKRFLMSIVYVAPIQWQYLRYQIVGGRKSERTIPVPVNIRLNKFGNIPGRRKGIIKKPSQFIDTIRGVAGVWERGSFSRGRKAGRTSTLRLLAAFRKTVKYRPILPFQDIVRDVVLKHFSTKFKKRLDDALRTAKF